MSLQEISALAQVGANLAVLASVLFLAVQARIGARLYLKDTTNEDESSPSLSTASLEDRP